MYDLNHYIGLQIPAARLIEHPTNPSKEEEQKPGVFDVASSPRLRLRTPESHINPTVAEKSLAHPGYVVNAKNQCTRHVAESDAAIAHPSCINFLGRLFSECNRLSPSDYEVLLTYYGGFRRAYPFLSV